MFTFNDDNGAEPPFTLAMTIYTTDVLGNVIMHEVSGRDYIGEHFAIRTCQVRGCWSDP